MTIEGAVKRGIRKYLQRETPEALYLQDNEKAFFGYDKDYYFIFDGTNLKVVQDIAASGGVIFSTKVTTANAYFFDCDTVTIGTGVEISCIGLSSGKGLFIDHYGSSTLLTGSLFQIRYDSDSISTGWVFSILGGALGTSAIMNLSKNSILGLSTLDLETWTSYSFVLESVNTAIFFGLGNDIHIISNAYFDGVWKYKETNKAAKWYVYEGVHKFRTAASGTADTAISWIDALWIGAGNVGVRVTADPHSYLQVNGSLALKQTAVTASFTYDVTGYLVSADATLGAITGTLPTAVGITGRVYGIKKIDSSVNAVTIDGAGTETIDGALTWSTATQWAGVFIMSNGANWVKIATF